MAKDQALQFIIRVNEDKALQGKLEAVTKDGVQGIVKVAQEAGFVFTADEFQTVAYEQWASKQSSEISEDELDTVAGGVKIVTPITFQKFQLNFTNLNNPGTNAAKW